ncbi:MAG TPA: hypothetical protein VK908_01750 [Jiangellales bacterium]|nr:hypothetical protein [Jiangellales bacterium]
MTADERSTHPGTSELADLDAGLLDRDRANGVREHLAACAACAQESAAFLAVRSALAAEPDPGPVPPDVAARLDEALAVAAAERGLPLGPPAPEQPVDELSARRRMLPRLLAAAAAVGIVGIGAWAALGGVSGGGGDATTAGGADTARELSTADAPAGEADDAAGAAEAPTTTEPETLLDEPEAPAEEEAAVPPAPEAAPPPTEEEDRQRLTALTAAVAAGEPAPQSGPPGCGEAYAEADGTGLIAAVPTTYEGVDAVLLVVPGPGFGVNTGVVVPTCDALPGDELTTVEITP